MSSLLIQPLPFTNFRLPREQLAHVEARLCSWSLEHSFGDRRFRSVSSTYLEFCSPNTPSDRGLDLVADYLGWFFLLNDLPMGAGKVKELKAARDAFLGQPADNCPAATATINFAAKFRESLGNQNCSRLERRLTDMLEALLWEAEQPNSPPPTTPLYCAYREILIADYPYLELWRLAEGMAVEERHWAPFGELERLHAKIAYLTNDILSAARDERLGKLNTLFCVMEERSVSLEEAKSRCCTELHVLVDRFVTLADALNRRSKVSATEAQYVATLGSIAEGNRLAALALVDRYR